MSRAARVRNKQWFVTEAPAGPSLTWGDQLPPGAVLRAGVAGSPLLRPALAPHVKTTLSVPADEGLGFGGLGWGRWAAGGPHINEGGLNTNEGCRPGGCTRKTKYHLANLPGPNWTTASASLISRSERSLLCLRERGEGATETEEAATPVFPLVTLLQRLALELASDRCHTGPPWPTPRCSHAPVCPLEVRATHTRPPVCQILMHGTVQVAEALPPSPSIPGTQCSERPAEGLHQPPGWGHGSPSRSHGGGRPAATILSPRIPEASLPFVNSWGSEEAWHPRMLPRPLLISRLVWMAQAARGRGPAIALLSTHPASGLPSGTAGKAADSAPQIITLEKYQHGGWGLRSRPMGEELQGV